jgi:FkbM family methyltransferase
MNKVHRKNANIGVAFASSAKRITQKAPQASSVESYPCHNESLTRTENIETLTHAENIETPAHREIAKFGRAKAFLRPLARIVYRLLKPAFRPVAFRLRRYLVESLHQDVLNAHALSMQELQQVSAGLGQELHVTRELLRQDILNSHAQSLQELQRMSADMLQEVSAGILQELQIARESLKQNILSTHTISLQELQLAYASLLQEVQAARGSLNQSVGMLQEIQAHSSNLFPLLDRIEQYSNATARRVAISCSSDEILIRTEVGYILCSASDHAVLACLIENGELERGTRQLIQRFLCPGDVFVDVGANLGLHTLAAARAMQGCGKIIAFEPYGPTKCLFEKSVWINGFSEITDIHQAAVSNTTGHQKLFLGATSGHHSLFPVDAPYEILSKSVEVPLVRLDDIILADQKVNLIKIDAEGAELEIIDSAAPVIERNPDIALIVEFSPSQLKRTSHSTEQWLSAFTNLGLIHRMINAETGTLEDCSLEQLEGSETINLFFARPDSKAWSKVETSI